VPIIDPALIHGFHLTRLGRADARADVPDDDTVFQTSTIAALVDGAYDGDLTFGELARHGDFGLGTLQQLDGEMIALDGTFYAARADGTVSVIPPDTRTPFAVVVPWRTEQVLTTKPGFPGMRKTPGVLDHVLSLEAIGAEIDRAMPPDGNILAVRVKGRFSRVQARSVPKQQPPYPPLSEVARQQVIFEWNDLDATLVGFRFPASARGFELVGYHWHVLSDDRARGGHLLDCTMISGVVEFNRADELHVEIPAGLSWRSPRPDAARDAVLERLERSVQRSSV
jgi:acetolactate decarboxylase